MKTHDIPLMFQINVITSENPLWGGGGGGWLYKVSKLCICMYNQFIFSRKGRCSSTIAVGVPTNVKNSSVMIHKPIAILWDT